MKPRKEYIALALIIAALSAYLMLHKQDRLHYKMPRLEILHRKNITKITVNEASSGVTLQKREGRWLILPEKFPADSALVDEMAGKISTLTLTALAGGGGYDSVYGLEASSEIKVAAYSGDKILRSFEVGKAASTGRQTFVKLDKDKRIFYADGDFRHFFDKKVGDLRNKTVLSLDDHIIGITIQKGARESVFVKSPPETEGKLKGGKETSPQMWQTSAGAAADGRKIDKIISALSSLSCDSFVPSKTKKDFRNPTYVVTLRGKESYTFSLFKKEGDRYPAISSQSDYPFYLQGWEAEPTIKDLAGLAPAIKEAGHQRGKKI